MSYLRTEPATEREFPPFEGVLKRNGFIPNLFRYQGDRLELIPPQLALGGMILHYAGALERRQKECIFIAVSARNLSTYCVVAHCEMARTLKLEGFDPEQIAIDHTVAKIPLRDKALINFALKLNSAPNELSQDDVDRLRTFGFSDAHIQEAILVTAMARSANTISFGLGTQPDFENERIDYRK